KRPLRAPNGLRLEWVDADAPIAVPDARQSFVVSRAGDSGAWNIGRADMHYRDLIPDRFGGRFVASHIRIPQGGPVPDYVHYHNIRFQMIYCRAGWVRVVYEDQGPPFVMHAGDCVLQPPGIRHRVLESSPDLEVIELGCPARHETCADHEMKLPTPHVLPHRRFGSQRFVRHVAADATWQPSRRAGFEVRDTGIDGATAGLAGVRVLRRAPSSTPASGESTNEAHCGELMFLFVLRGELTVTAGRLGSHHLQADDSCVIPAGVEHALQGSPDIELLEVTLPA
ncbi:MAG: cupin domain-containing protein, partial [Rhodanobacteraceae bacterium]